MGFQWFEVYMERGVRLRPRYNKKAPKWIRKIRHNSLFYKGPQLFNLLPSELRQHEFIDTPGQEHVDAFKKKLDDHLLNIPDQPNVPGLTRAATTNSLICQIPVYNRQNR